MRPFKRPNFVLHHNGHRLEGSERANDYRVAVHAGRLIGSRRPTLVDDVPPPAPEPDEPHETLDEPSAQPHPLERSRSAQAGPKWLVTDGESAAAPIKRDADIAERMVGLVQDLNRTMSEALERGLIVEPVLARQKSRYSSLDGEGSYVLSMKLFRKLC